jgi:hypothetical protein
LLTFVIVLAYSPVLEAAGPATPQLLEQQRIALQRLARYDGVWRGQATIYNADGSKLELVQTERVGPMLDGTLRVIEGRGYVTDGTLVFNAFAVISFAPDSGKYTFRSYAQGYAGNFPLEVQDEGFTWSIPAGPATLRYTSTVKNDLWVEVGERVEPGRPPVTTFEMRLRKVESTGWPAAGASGLR